MPKQIEYETPDNDNGVIVKHRGKVYYFTPETEIGFVLEQLAANETSEPETGEAPKAWRKDTD